MEDSSFKGTLKVYSKPKISRKLLKSHLSCDAQIRKWKDTLVIATRHRFLVKDIVKLSYQ